MKKRILLLATLGYLLPGYGLIYFIPSGETSTIPIILDNDRDELLIDEGGTLATGAMTAVVLNADDQNALNKGTISTTGDNAFGILIFENNNARVTNQGLISTSGDVNAGIFALTATNAVIINDGKIVTTGDGGLGIAADAIINTVITNNGSIETAGEAAVGIAITNSTATKITNTGSISTTGGVASHGMFFQGNVVTVVINSGTISTAEGSGIFNLDNGSSITNSGTISTTGANAWGIFNSGDNVQIINAGTIRSAQFFAIESTGVNPTLTLLRGSNIQGPVRVINSPLNLNVELGLNLALTLTDDSVGFANLGIEAPFVIVGNTVAVIDPTGFAMQADIVTDLSDSVLNNIYHLHGCCSCRTGLWIEGIGSYRNRSRGSRYVGYDNWQGGFLAGIDTPFCDGKASLFGGATFGEGQVDQHTQKADVNSYFGGLAYATCFCNTTVGVAIASGYIDWDNDRFVMNNLAEGGIETAHASIDGPFVSSEVVLSQPFYFFECQPIASFTLRNVGFFPGSYREKGSIASLSIKDRKFDLLTSRFELALPCCYRNACCCLSGEPYAGFFGRYQVGGYRVHGQLLGLPIRFNQEGPRHLAAFLLGFRGIHSCDCLDLFLNIEVSFDTSRSSRLLGEGGVQWNF